MRIEEKRWVGFEVILVIVVIMELLASWRDFLLQCTWYLIFVSGFGGLLGTLEFCFFNYGARFPC